MKEFHYHENPIVITNNGKGGVPQVISNIYILYLVSCSVGSQNVEFGICIYGTLPRLFCEVVLTWNKIAQKISALNSSNELWTIE